MNVRALDDHDRAEILRRDILPLLFPDARSSDDPALELLTAQPGSGLFRVAARLHADDSDEITILSADELRVFHPWHAELSASATVEAAGELAAVTAAWLSGAMVYAREHRRSALIEGSFTNPSVALRTAQRFAAEGFRTRIVIAGVRRPESLLSTASLYLRGVQAGGPAHFVSRDAHNRGFEATRAVAVALEDSGQVDRVTILGRDGTPAFDVHSDGKERAFHGATAALLAVQSERLTSLQSAQWLSELRRVTEFAATLRNPPRALTELLIDLHETALREIIPELPVPDGSSVVATQARASASDLVALRRSLAEHGPIDAAAPSVAVGGPERGGPSR
ncbi:zeta toxin family protein [Microbacterium sp. DT81.1]|uniref:zeta toxin family protein n=1 Tax=Microbacterium sp. DT81.1 TaxID=3393413 RepID=UPI003CF38451